MGAIVGALVAVSIPINVFLFFIVDHGNSVLTVAWSLTVFSVCVIRSVGLDVTIAGRRGSLFRIDFVFLLFYFMLFLMPYLASMLGLADLAYSRFVLDTFVLGTNKSILLSCVGISAFLTGYTCHCCSMRSPLLRNKADHSYANMLPLCVGVFSILLGVVFFTLLPRMVSGTYAGASIGSTTENGIYYLTTFFSLMVVACLVYRFMVFKILGAVEVLSTLMVILWGCVLLIAGDRNSFFLIATAACVGCFTYSKVRSNVAFVVLVVAALLTYSVIEKSRKADERGFHAITSAIQSLGSAGGNVFQDTSLTNTTITSRATVLLVPSKYEHTYGSLTTIGAMGIVPYSRGVLDSAKIDYFTSAELLTEAILGPYATWGIGTNVVSDLYIDFGVIGVAVGLLLVGVFGRRVQERLSCSFFSLKYFTVYVVTFSLFAELPRYGIAFPVRYIVWTYLVFFFYEVVFSQVSNPSSSMRIDKRR